MPLWSMSDKALYTLALTLYSRPPKIVRYFLPREYRTSFELIYELSILVTGSEVQKSPD